MERFIKLHLMSGGEEVWIRVGTIGGFRRHGRGSEVFPERKRRWEVDRFVTETPEEILAMIEQRPATPTVDEDGCCDVCGRDVHGCAACSGYVDPENIRETRGRTNDEERTV